MQTRPPGIDDRDVLAAVVAGWGIPVVTSTYLPVGFGSHHWEVCDGDGNRWFTCVDAIPAYADAQALRSGPLAAALALATHARDAGVECVVAPLPTSAGGPVVALGEWHALTVYPHVDGEAFRFSDSLSAPESAELLDGLTSLHAVELPPQGGRHEDFVLARHEELETLSPGHGVFADRLREFVGQHRAHVQRGLRQHDALVAAAGPQDGRLVITHGEPHPANVLRTAHGLRLVDWETALIAPPERDLWHLSTTRGTDAGSVAAAYAERTGQVLLPELLALYDLDWLLADIGEYVAMLGAATAETADTAWSWDALVESTRALAARI